MSRALPAAPRHLQAARPPIQGGRGEARRPHSGQRYLGTTTLLVLLACFLPTPRLHAQTQVYTDEASYLAALSGAGYLELAEGFESNAWDDVRSTIATGTITAPSVTSRGITWSASDGVTTVNVFPHSGTWRGYDHPGGMPDTMDGSSATTLYGIGGWFTASVLPASVRLFIDGVSPDNANLVLSHDYQFIGVISTTGFTTFELLGDGAAGDEKHWFVDDVTFAVTTLPPNGPPNGTITSPSTNPTILAGGSVSFSGSVTDQDGDPVTVEWSFDDSTTSNLLAPGAHTFAAAGTYTVTFTATDSHGLADPSPDTVTVTVLQPGGVTVSPTSGLVTSEAGDTATFTVVLTTEPTSTVTIGLSTSDPGEGSVSPSSLSFGPGDWSTPKTATVTGVDDPVVDGDVAYTIVTGSASSADPAYTGLNPQDVTVTNTDNDSAGFSITPTTPLETSESGATAQFSVVLTSKPSGTVSIALASSDPSEGNVSPSSLSFDSFNWGAAHTVTVSGVDDSAVDGTVSYSVVTTPTSSFDPNYLGLDPADVAVSNLDDEVAGVGTLQLTHIAGGLESPVGVVAPVDGTGRLMVAEQTGRLRVVTGAGEVLPTPFLDLSPSVSCCDEQGLLGLALHPGFPTDPSFFVDYTDTAGDTVVARYQVSAIDPDLADPLSASTVITQAQPYPNHNGGNLAFGPGGYLFVGLGDGGGTGDPDGNGQDLGTLLGAILRIDVDSGSPYTIPADNPFNGVAAAKPEIWAWGLRNPWRFSFDRFTGDLTITDQGEGSWEEIDREAAGTGGGANYGWNSMEGSHCYSPPTGCEDPSFAQPVLEYDHSLGRCGVVGGFVYRGRLIPDLQGAYVFGDSCTGEIWAGVADPGGWASTLVVDAPFPISSFGEDADGELLVVKYDPVDGAVYRLEDTTGIFGDGFEAGDASPWSFTTP